MKDVSKAIWSEKEVETDILVRWYIEAGMITRHDPRFKPTVFCCGTPFSSFTLRGTSDGYRIITLGDGEGTQGMGVFEQGDKRHCDCEFEVSVASEVAAKISQCLPRGSDMAQGRSRMVLRRI